MPPKCHPQPKKKEPPKNLKVEPMKIAKNKLASQPLIREDVDSEKNFPPLINDVDNDQFIVDHVCVEAGKSPVTFAPQSPAHEPTAEGAKSPQSPTKRLAKSLVSNFSRMTAGNRALRDPQHVPIDDAKFIVNSYLLDNHPAAQANGERDKSTLLIRGRLYTQAGSNPLTSKWVPIFVELHTHKMMCYEDENMTKKKKEIVLTPHTRAIRFVDRPEQFARRLKQRPNGFALDMDPEHEGGGQRRYKYFDASTQCECMMWTGAIDWKDMSVVCGGRMIFLAMQEEERDYIDRVEFSRLIIGLSSTCRGEVVIPWLQDFFAWSRKNGAQTDQGLFSQVENEVLKKHPEYEPLVKASSPGTDSRGTFDFGHTKPDARAKRTKAEDDEVDVETRENSGNMDDEQAMQRRFLDLMRTGVLKITLWQAWNIPTTQKVWVSVEVNTYDRGLVAQNRSSAISSDRHHSVWNECFHLPALEGEYARKDDVGPKNWDPNKALVKFVLHSVRGPCKGFVGQCIVPLADFFDHRVVKLCLWDKQGDPIVSSTKPYKPCMLSLSLNLETLPKGWPTPEMQSKQRLQQYPYHVFMMTRGTRGDVQPFVALARGMAEMNGWLVTLCTETRWKTFIKDNAKVSRGRIRFRPSGGDTLPRVQNNAWAVNAKTEILQMAILAFAESEFFNSTSVFLAHVTDAEMEEKPVDLLVCGLTTTGSAMLIGELCGKPFVPFVLQPSIIPSKGNWLAIEKVRSHILGALDSVESVLFTGHGALQRYKYLAEHNPFAKYTISDLRKMHGLRPCTTWSALRERRIPLVIPMKDTTFARPPDWWKEIVMSDFIFLRNNSGPSKSGLGEILDNFISNARARGGKLCVMTFSSMNVSRQSVFNCCVKMVEQGKFNAHVIFVGEASGKCTTAVDQKATDLQEEGRFLNIARADFGLLFKEMDCFVVHGGLGTTVEALRMQKPVTVTGPLLLDQRFWGKLCHEKGVGLKLLHIDEFHRHCVQFIDGALDPSDPYGWQSSARDTEKNNWGQEGDDGVRTNVECFERILAECPVQTAAIDLATINPTGSKKITVATE